VARKKKSFLKKEINVPLPGKLASGRLGKSRRIRLPRYIRESLQEIKKVSWPGKKETWKLTFAVIVFTSIFTVFIIIVDIIFKELAQRIFL